MCQHPRETHGPQQQLLWLFRLTQLRFPSNWYWRDLSWKQNGSRKKLNGRCAVGWEGWIWREKMMERTWPHPIIVEIKIDSWPLFSLIVDNLLLFTRPTRHISSQLRSEAPPASVSTTIPFVSFPEWRRLILDSFAIVISRPPLEKWCVIIEGSGERRGCNNFIL